MARNDTEQDTSHKDTAPRKTYAELEKERSIRKKKVLDQASLADKVRYESTCDSRRFRTFLESRLPIWEAQKDKTFHAKRMYEKTAAILTDFKV